jgi:hypothetical protein
MAQVIIRIDSITTAYDSEWRASVAELRQSLRERSHSTDIETEKRYYGVGPEQVAIYIGLGSAATLITAVVQDVYSTAKNWARKRFDKRAHQVRPRPIHVTFYGPDGELLFSFKIDSDGEHEHSFDKDNGPPGN